MFVFWVSAPCFPPEGQQLATCGIALLCGPVCILAASDCEHRPLLTLSRNLQVGRACLAQLFQMQLTQVNYPNVEDFPSASLQLSMFTGSSLKLSPNHSYLCRCPILLWLGLWLPAPHLPPSSV